jgi:hypothetical protein
MDYKKLLGYALSSDDILNMMDNKTKIITYGQLGQFDDVETLLKPFDNIILIYESAPNYGHWVALFKTPRKTIEFFDSYGLFIDDEKNFISKTFLNKSGQKHNYLSKLLYETKTPIDYNDVCLQSEDKNVATCGRWCITRIKEKHLTLPQFVKKYKQDGDKKVIDYTQKLI